MNEQTAQAEVKGFNWKGFGQGLKIGSIVVAGVATYTAIAGVSTAIMNDLGEKIIDTVF